MSGIAACTPGESERLRRNATHCHLRSDVRSLPTRGWRRLGRARRTIERTICSEPQCFRNKPYEHFSTEPKSTLSSGATANVDHDYLPVLADGSPLTPGVLGHIRKLAKENTSLREELTSAKRKSITIIESVKQNDKKFSVCSGLPNYDAFEVLCGHLGPKAKAPGPDGGEESRGKAALLQKEKGN